MDSEKNVETIATALEELNEKVVFVGAAISCFLIDPVNHDDLRETVDIDAAAMISDYSNFTEFEGLLTQKGFKRSTKEKDPTCRWYYQGLQFDLVPLVPCGTHISNKWYKKSLNSVSVRTVGEIEIKHLDSIFYIASKLEAFFGRGNPEELVSSHPDDNHDLEDIILLLDGRRSIVDELGESEGEVREYIKSQFAVIIGLLGIEEFVRNCLSPHSIDERSKRVLGIFGGV